MNITQIEKNIETLTENFSKETFIYDLLRAYGLPKATITLLQKGTHNLSKQDGQIILKKKLLFQEMLEGDNLHATIDELQNVPANQKHDPRFIIVTDYKLLLAVDTKTLDTLDIAIDELPEHPHFFAPWAGMEKYQHQNENIADVKAAERMAKLYDHILKDNPEIVETKEELHKLNVFLSRLLFCFFAEDTNIFADNAFTNSVSSHTQEDGSDLDQHLNKLFEVLNTQNRDDLPSHLKDFPYVNGGLFGDSYDAPKFSRKSRNMMIESGKQQWKDINPDIFGSMIQAVVHPDQRGGMGMHYTSVPNIMKVIEPLFLSELREDFEKNKHNPKGLEKLLARLSTFKIFDPACGSGNFLIIAYKELRMLEIRILEQLKILSDIARDFDDPQISFIPKAQLSLAASYMPSFLSRISLSQFYGIELDDFAHEVAILSLWLAEHQMNVKFNEAFQKKLPSLPLKEGGKIVWGNATRIPWEDVCPKTEGAEIYILGNPPYLGSSQQDKNQKSDMAKVFEGIKGYKNLDYIACWFLKGATYISNFQAKLAFVSTNSIAQGEQVSLLWPHISNQNLEIFFAHQAFKWTNNAKGNAGVTVVIIGLQNKSNSEKIIFRDSIANKAKNISPYLTSGSDLILSRRSSSVSGLPKMLKGNQPTDGGNFILTTEEKESLCNSYPQAAPLVKRYYGSQEFIKGQVRWCLWIQDNDLELAVSIPPIKNRIRLVGQVRAESDAPSTRDFKGGNHKFIQIQSDPKNALIVPSVSSERRLYIPVGFVDQTAVISNLAFAVYDPEPYVFSLIASKMHLIWVKATSGGLETRIRYSNVLSYNTFPIPDLTQKQKETLTQHAFNVLDARDAHPEKTIAELYEPKKMPDDLREAHHDLDLAVERCYRSKPFTSDEERLEYLFKLYEEMTANEQAEKIA